MPPCSDGHLVPGEECDDGNLTSGDGCDRNCTVTRCGNAVVTAGEQCDDGNRVSGDGCEPDCTVGPIVTTTSTTTTTTTATTPTSSTTTTMALAVCTVCDDGDPCTIDTCTSEGCRHEALTGWEATQCVCGVIPDVITRRIERAEHLMNLATMTAAPSDAKRLRAKAARNFRRAILLAGRAIRRGRISPACAGSLAQTLASELARARRLGS